MCSVSDRCGRRRKPLSVLLGGPEQSYIQAYHRWEQNTATASQPRIVCVCGCVYVCVCMFLFAYQCVYVCTRVCVCVCRTRNVCIMFGPKWITLEDSEKASKTKQD